MNVALDDRAPPEPHGGPLMIGCWASSPIFINPVDLKNQNPKAIFNFLKILETLDPCLKRKKRLIKEREYIYIYNT